MGVVKRCGQDVCVCVCRMARCVGVVKKVNRGGGGGGAVMLTSTWLEDALLVPSLGAVQGVKLAVDPLIIQGGTLSNLHKVDKIQIQLFVLASRLVKTKSPITTNKVKSP